MCWTGFQSGDSICRQQDWAVRFPHMEAGAALDIGAGRYTSSSDTSCRLQQDQPPLGMALRSDLAH